MTRLTSLSAASVATLLTLTGCADDPVAKPDNVLQASRLCQEVGQPGDCDVCEYYGWYRDGECDGFCATEDVDCEMDASPDGAMLDTITVPDDTGVEIPDATGARDAYHDDSGSDAGVAMIDAGADSGALDGGFADASFDASSSDAGAPDGGFRDGGTSVDTGIPDATPVDAFPADAMDGGADGGFDGGGLTDSGIYDGGPDSGYDGGFVGDGGSFDSGVDPDASTDGGFFDAGPGDSGIDGSLPPFDGGITGDVGVSDVGIGGDVGTGPDVGGGLPDVGTPDGSF